VLPDPKDGIASYESLKHALTVAARGDDEAAVGELRRLVASQPRMLDAWEALGKSLERLNRTADAVAAFGKVLEIDPLKPETHLALARILALDRQAARASEHAKLAAERDPAAAYEALAELSMDAGRRDEAVAFARKSVDADPSRYMSHFLLGVIAQQQGRCDQAIASFRRAIDAKRTDPHAVVRNLHAGLADCLARSGQTAEAEREFKAELADIPSSPEARVGLATLYRSQGRDAEARDVLGQLVTATPGADASTYWTVVHTLTVLGDLPAAREWSARAHERFPSDPRFR
jgi:tetratricopeptide (TPR) repeat protein